MWLSVATGLNWCVEMVAAGSNWRLEINGGRCVAEDFLPAEIVLAEWSGCRAELQAEHPHLMRTLVRSDFHSARVVVAAF
mmetsp:Transcript_62724/g.91937  ORF Transcript_62724/g.91937 Transcript_62724/m.91937 type:complete len:80 (+) Transcript_62724:305-544(+)